MFTEKSFYQEYTLKRFFCVGFPIFQSFLSVSKKMLFQCATIKRFFGFRKISFTAPWNRYFSVSEKDGKKNKFSRLPKNRFFRAVLKNSFFVSRNIAFSGRQEKSDFFVFRNISFQCAMKKTIYLFPKNRFFRVSRKRDSSFIR